MMPAVSAIPNISVRGIGVESFIGQCVKDRDRSAGRGSDYINCDDDRDYHYQVTGEQNWSEAVRVSRFVGGILYMKSCPTKRDTSTFDYSLLKEFPASIAR